MQTTSKAPLLAGAGAGGAAPAGTGTSTAPPEPPKSKFKPLPPPPKSKLLRFMGINPAAMKDFIPSRKTSMYFTLIASPFLLYMYDRRCAERIMDEYKARVSHLAERPLPEPLEGGGGGARGAGSPDAALEFPRKVWIMSSRVPDDFEEDRGNRWFKTYIKVGGLVAAQLRLSQPFSTPPWSSFGRRIVGGSRSGEMHETGVGTRETYSRRISSSSSDVGTMPHQTTPQTPPLQPVLYAAGYDYSFLNGTAPGALGRRVSERIRLERIANMASTTSTDTLINPGEPGYLESLDKRRHARAMGLTVIVGRNTLKEYLWGLKQGWLVDFDAVKEEKGDEGRTQELKEELMKDGRFDQDVRPPGLIDVEGAAESGEEEEESQGSTPSSSSTSSSTASPGSALFPPRSSYSLFSAPASAYSSTTASSTSPEHEGPGAEAATEKSLIVPAASEIPAQPPLLILPYDHPLGFLRLWPIKMIKWAFMERYRVRQGCETALAIIQATHPAPFTDSSSASSSSASSFAPEHSATSSIQHPSFTSDSDDLSRGIRYIQPPKRPEAVNAQQEERSITIEDIVTENQKKLKPEWRGDEIPETGSKDLDCGDWTEYHYRKVRECRVVARCQPGLDPPLPFGRVEADCWRREIGAEDPALMEGSGRGERGCLYTLLNAKCLTEYMVC